MDISWLQAVLTAGAAIAAVIIAGRHQMKATRLLVETEVNKLTASRTAEFERLQAQMFGEARARRLERKQDWILDTVPKLLLATDPDLRKSLAAENVVREVYRLQLMLDPRIPSDLALHLASIELANVTRRSMTEGAELQEILAAQSAVTEAARKVMYESADEAGRPPTKIEAKAAAFRRS